MLIEQVLFSSRALLQSLPQLGLLFRIALPQSLLLLLSLLDQLFFLELQLKFKQLALFELEDVLGSVVDWYLFEFSRFGVDVGSALQMSHLLLFLPLLGHLTNSVVRGVQIGQVLRMGLLMQ